MKNFVFFLLGIAFGAYVFYHYDSVIDKTKNDIKDVANYTKDKFSHIKFINDENGELEASSEIHNPSNSTINSNSINFVRNSSVLPIEDNMVIKDDAEFQRLSKHYLDIIQTIFTPNQIRCVKQIIISDSEAFDDNCTGLTSVVNGKNAYILLAAYSSDADRAFLHEMCHAIHMTNEKMFNDDFKYRWLACNGYVSDYAQTDIYEDFAETGAWYFLGETSSENEKFKLFKEFFNLTK